MAKELPYFKFFCSEWSDGDITLEDYATQGLFINICAYYWSNECILKLSKLKKRFKDQTEIIDVLIENNLIKLIDDSISINFLNEQKIERGEISKVKSKGGIASAEAKKIAKNQQNLNTTSTEKQQVLNFCSTEGQVLREEKRREEEIREEKKREDDVEIKIVDNGKFISEAKISQEWLESIAMDSHVPVDVVKLFLDPFETHLIKKHEQKKGTGDFRNHFSWWFPKQDLSQFRKKVYGKTNQH